MANYGEVRITHLKAENFMRVKIVELGFDENDNFVEICGNNGEGKSSLFTAIMYALAGKQKIDVPIRKGADGALIEVTTDKFVVRRIFTQKNKDTGGALEIKTLKGVKVSSPQTTLDKMFSSISFDPEAFSKMHGKEQVDCLMKFLGLDFAELNARCKEIYSKRTTVGAVRDDLRGKSKQMPYHENIPETAGDMTDMEKELEQLESVSRRKRQAANEMAELESGLNNFRSKAKDKGEHIKHLEAELEQQRKEFEEMKAAGKEKAAAVEKIRAEVSAMPDPDESRMRELNAALSDTRHLLVKINENKHRRDAIADADAKAVEYDKLTAEIEEIDAQKRKMIADSKMPVEGLSFDPEGENLLWDDLPLSAASSAQQIVVSTLMGFALNPQCKLLMIHNGSLLDNNTRKKIAEISKENGGMVLSEVAGTQGEMGVLLEGGEVAEDRRHKA